MISKQRKTKYISQSYKNKEEKLKFREGNKKEKQFIHIYMKCL